jgi:hypothetical protein
VIGEGQKKKKNLKYSTNGLFDVKKIVRVVLVIGYIKFKKIKKLHKWIRSSFKNRIKSSRVLGNEPVISNRNIQFKKIINCTNG